jgi:hypothetical protein
MTADGRLFDPDEGERRKLDAMGRADAHAAGDWRTVARRCVRHAAETRREFTTDHLWALLARHYPNVHTHEPRAMGPLMVWAQKNGLVEPTDRVSLSNRPEHHRYPCRVWRSRVFQPERVP